MDIPGLDVLGSITGGHPGVGCARKDYRGEYRDWMC